MFEYNLLERARQSKQRIVLCEGEEPRILQATDILLRREAADIILLGDKQKIVSKAAALGLDQPHRGSARGNRHHLGPYRRALRY